MASAAGCAASTASEEGATGDPQAETSAGECNATGTWAMKIETPVKFAGSVFVQGGTGNVVALVKIARTQNGTTISDVGKICNISAPDYSGTAIVGAEHYGTRFPAGAFDAPSMPAFNLSVSLSGKAPGATFTAPATAALIGATLPNPVADAWPNVSALVSSDADGDGKPGISADSATGGDFKDPPVNPQRTARANRVYTAFRQVIQNASGTVKSCSRAEATADVTQLNEHVLGCRKEDGTECNTSEFKLLDSVAPVFVPTGKANITTVKIAEAATCADVRALNFDSIQ